MNIRPYKTFLNGYLKTGDVYGRQYLDSLEKRHRQVMKNLQNGFEIDCENIKQDFNKIIKRRND